MTESTETSLVARCLCGQNNIPVQGSLPRTAHVCHCTTCRISHGTLFSMHADIEVLPFSADSPPATLKIYQSDPGRSGKAFFCNKCGTYMFATYTYEYKGKMNDGTCVSAGCLSLSPEYQASHPDSKLEDVLSIDFHCFFENTIDGGAAPWVGNWKLENQAHFNKSWEDAPYTEEQTKALFTKHTYPTGRKELEGSCKCGSVKIKISRENEDIKYQTSFCACDSCRLSTGTDVVPFTRVPRNNAVFILNGNISHWPQVWDDDSKAEFSNLIVYETTPGKISWGACGTCAARVFYQRYGEMYEGAEVVQPLTALFGADTTQGVLHMDFLRWVGNKTEGVGLMEDAINAGRAGILSKNMSERYGAWLDSLRS